MKRISDLACGMRPLVISVALLAGALTMVGCASTTGVKVDEDATAFIQKGKTTKQDVIAKLGTPTTTSKDSSGKETLVWQHSRATVDAKSFIPFAGIFLGGGTTEYSEFTVTLDKRGVVLDTNKSNSKIDSKLYGG